MNHQLVLTADGSHTLYVPELNEHYHSTRGAITESKHVFIEAGLHYALQYITHRPLQLLEIGFGTGLNALITKETCDTLQLSCRYETIEKYPLSLSEINKLNYASKELARLHSCEWERETELSTYFSIHKMAIDLLLYQPMRKFDVIFFDAFAPEIQPDLWTESVFKKLYDSQSDKGVLLTYSSKGTVKQALRNAGYQVQRLQGAGGKRHMIRATRDN